MAFACPRLPALEERLALHFREFRFLDGTWERMHAALRERPLRERVRVGLNSNPQPSAGIVESQSIKTTGVGAGERGYDDGAKKVKGLKSATCW